MRAILALAGMLLAGPALAQIVPPDGSDLPPGPGTPQEIPAPGTTYFSNIDFEGDVDAHTTHLVADGRTIAFMATGYCHKMSVKIYDAGFNLLKESWPASPTQDGAFVEWRPLYSGLHYVTVTDLPLPADYVCPPGWWEPFYKLQSSVSCAPDDSTQCQLRPGEIRGTLVVGNRNWYKIEIPKRAVLTFRARLKDGNLHPILTLRHRDGHGIAGSQTQCAEGNSCLTAFVCRGTYYLAIRDDTVPYIAGYEVTMEPPAWGGRGLPCP
jgi:hypothetical protein